jgi:plasmid stability protein
MNMPSDDTNFVRITFRVPRDLAENLRVQAAENLRSLNNEMVQRLQASVKAIRRPRPADKVSGASP